MFPDTLLLVLTIHAVALISPGPDFAVITRLAIVGGRNTGIWGAIGTASGIGLYTLTSLLGLTLVVNALPGLSRVLSIVGALYLMWLGIQCLRSRGQMPQADSRQGHKRAFFTGFLTNLFNPKGMLYFGSIFSQVITPDPNALHMAGIWVAVVAESFLWFAVVAVLFSSPRMLGWLKTRLRWFDRIIGVVLLGLAAKVGSAGF